MTVANLIALIRRDTGVTATQLTDENITVYINKIYKDIVSAIHSRLWTENAKDAEEFIDAVADTSEYTLTVPTSSVASLSKLLVVYIKTDSSDDYYTKARQIALTDLDYSWDRYLTNQSTGDPIYRVVDNKIHIAPQFTSSTAWGASNNQIWIIWKDSVVDLASDWAESTILIPENYHYLIATGVAVEVYRFRQQLDRKNDAMNEYMLKKEEMLAEIAQKVEANTPMQMEYEYILE